MTGKDAAINEPPIDRSRDHFLEAHALERAMALAEDASMRGRVEGLAARRDALMEARAAFNAEATRCRHARGEIYSASRIAALNALGPSLEELEQTAQTLYGRRSTSIDVLKAHARVHFGNVLAMARLNLANMPPDISVAARAMQAQEEAFANAWLAAIDDDAFRAGILKAQREALRSMRTSTRPMYLVIRPAAFDMEQAEAIALGKAWNKLDELATTLGVEPLSTFIAVPGEEDAAGVAPARIATSVAALCEAAGRAEHKLPGKKAVRACLQRMHDALVAMAEADGCAWFDIDL